MTAAIILAAGSASRMQEAGQPPVPKMLLPFRGKPILLHLLEAIADAAQLRYAVTGCFHEQLQPLLQQRDVQVVLNEHWEQGMGSSIARGIQQVMQTHPETKQVFILPADQPLTQASLLEQMLYTQQQTRKGMVACRYDDTVGIPALFSHTYFPALSKLTGQQGAKLILQQQPHDLALVDYPEGARDIDTPEDYKRLMADYPLTDPIPPVPGG